MKKILNQLFILVALPVMFITLAVMLGANVWIASALIIGLPTGLFLAIGIFPSVMDWFDRKNDGESEQDKIDNYLKRKS